MTQHPVSSARVLRLFRIPHFLQAYYFYSARYFTIFEMTLSTFMHKQ